MAKWVLLFECPDCDFVQRRSVWDPERTSLFGPRLTTVEVCPACGWFGDKVVKVGRALGAATWWKPWTWLRVRWKIKPFARMDQE